MPGQVIYPMVNPHSSGAPAPVRLPPFGQPVSPSYTPQPNMVGQNFAPSYGQPQPFNQPLNQPISQPKPSYVQQPSPQPRYETPSQPRTIVRGQTPTQDRPVAAVVMPSPEQLGVGQARQPVSPSPASAATATPAVDWAAVHQYAQKIGVTSLPMQKIEQGRYRFTLVLPGQAGGTPRQVVGEGSHEVEAVQQAFARVGTASR